MGAEDPHQATTAGYRHAAFTGWKNHQRASSDLHALVRGADLNSCRRIEEQEHVLVWLVVASEGGARAGLRVADQKVLAAGVPGSLATRLGERRELVELNVLCSRQDREHGRI